MKVTLFSVALIATCSSLGAQAISTHANLATATDFGEWAQVDAVTGETKFQKTQAFWEDKKKSKPKAEVKKHAVKKPVGEKKISQVLASGADATPTADSAGRRVTGDRIVPTTPSHRMTQPEDGITRLDDPLAVFSSRRGYNAGEATAASPGRSAAPATPATRGEATQRQSKTTGSTMADFSKVARKVKADKK